MSTLTLVERRTHRNQESRRRCPVCWRLVRPTKQIQYVPGRHWDVEAVIEGHWDTLGASICPGAYEPYRITLAKKPRPEKEVAA